VVSAAAHGSSSSITRVRTPMNSPHRNLPRRMELPLRYTLSGSLSGKHVCTGEARCGDSVATAAGDAGRSQGLLHGGQVECVWMLL